MNVPDLKYFINEAERLGLPIWEIAIAEESADGGLSRDAILEKAAATWKIMKAAAERGVASTARSLSGLTGGDANRYKKHIDSGRALLGALPARAAAYALATSEQNASMGVIVAAPTAGAAGILPGVLMAAQECMGFSDEDIVKAMITSSAVGCIIATNATVSGAAGGCQAECGSGAAMAAAALCYLMGGNDMQIMHAAALALKNCLGLACDPVAGLVEVPCVKRNGVFAVVAVTAADLALAGVESFIPPDEVIDAMHRIGMNMPASVKETAEGGLATTPTGNAARKKLMQDKA